MVKLTNVKNGRKTVKRAAAVMLILMLAATLCACGTVADRNNTEEAGQDKTTVYAYEVIEEAPKADYEELLTQMVVRIGKKETVIDAMELTDNGKGFSLTYDFNSFILNENAAYTSLEDRTNDVNLIISLESGYATGILEEKVIDETNDEYIDTYQTTFGRYKAECIEYGTDEYSHCFYIINENGRTYLVELFKSSQLDEMAEACINVMIDSFRIF